jgi:hypothetical protein
VTAPSGCGAAELVVISSIPEPNRSIGAARGECAAVRTEGDAEDAGLVTVESAGELPVRPRVQNRIVPLALADTSVLPSGLNLAKRVVAAL